MLFKDHPDTAWVQDKDILAELFPGRSHMFLPRMRARKDADFPVPVKLHGRNLTPVGELRAWAEKRLADREASTNAAQ